MEIVLHSRTCCVWVSLGGGVGRQWDVKVDGLSPNVGDGIGIGNVHHPTIYFINLFLMKQNLIFKIQFQKHNFSASVEARNNEYIRIAIHILTHTLKGN